MKGKEAEEGIKEERKGGGEGGDRRGLQEVHKSSKSTSCPFHRLGPLCSLLGQVSMKSTTESKIHFIYSLCLAIRRGEQSTILPDRNLDVRRCINSLID